VNPKRIFRKRLACCKLLIIFCTFRDARTLFLLRFLDYLDALECFKA